MAALSSLTGSGFRDAIEQHGWVNVRGLFSRREIAEMREQAREVVRSGSKSDLLSQPGIGRIVYDPRILDVATEILGAKPVYFGDGGVMGGIIGGSMEWHKDNPDRNDERGPDWRSRYTLIRMGIYLQDHSRHSGGLGIRDRSHNTPDLRVGKPMAVQSEVGDLLVWYLRTTHAGFAARLRFARNTFFPIRVLKRLVGPQYRLPPIFEPLPDRSPDERLAIFYTYGQRDAHLDRYLQYLKSRSYAVEQWQATKYTPERLAEATASGRLDVMDLGPEVAGMTVGQDRGHVQLAY
jgi:hypothetical protein